MQHMVTSHQWDNHSHASVLCSYPEKPKAATHHHRPLWRGQARLARALQHCAAEPLGGCHCDTMQGRQRLYLQQT